MRLKHLKAIRDGKGLEFRSFNPGDGSKNEIILEDGIRWEGGSCLVQPARAFIKAKNTMQVVNLDNFDVYFYEEE